MDIIIIYNVYPISYDIAIHVGTQIKFANLKLT